MSEMTDAEVFGAPKEMSDADVFGQPAAPTWGNVSEAIPEAFLDRVRAGQALSRITRAAGHEAKEGVGGQTPTGFSDENLAHLMDLGIFHDPAKSRGGPIQMLNEAAMIPAAQIWQSVTSAISGGIHGAGGAVGQIVEEFGGSQGQGNRAKNEVINAGNWAMIEGGMGRFSRPAVEGGSVMERPVGGLPAEADFVNAGKVLESPHAEANLRQMWKEDGITPAEAVHDAQTDAFLKHDLTAKQVEIDLRPSNGRPEFVPSYTPPDPLDLAMSGSLNVEAAERAASGVKQYYKDVEKHIFGDRAEEWDKLNRAADRASVNMNDKLSRELREKQSRLEDEVGLSPADEDLLGGAGKPDTYDPDFWKGLKEDLHEIELGRDDALATVAHQVRYLPKTRDWDAMNNSERQSTLVIFSALNAEKAAGRDPMLFLKEAFQQRKARYGGGADAAEIVEAQMMELRDLMDGAIERSGVAKSELRALPPPKAAPENIRLTQDEYEALSETGGRPGSLSAAMTEPGDIPLDVQPAKPPGSIMASIKATGDTLLDIGRDAQMLVAPMARGTKDSMAMAKDFANAMRRNRWDWDRIDTDVAKKFTPEQRARMWTAADEESVSIQLGEPASMREHQGLATLEPAERAAVEQLQARAQNAWLRARDAGMVEGEGLPAYTPRMIINTAGASAKETVTALDGKGGNLRTKTGNMLKRKYLESQETEAAAKAKYGDEAMLARDIRVLPLATSHLEDAIAGRTLINNIKDYGKRTGAETVVEGAIPVGSDVKWFTLDHPSFRTWRPKFEDGKAVVDAEGKTIFEQVPLYVHGDFEGPLRAVLSQKSGAAYGAMMSLKGKTMSMIMNSPMIHNAVEWGRALPAMPGKVATFKVYFEGNRAKNNPAIMGEAIDNGLVPIGHRFFNQDISGIMEAPDLTPGRSWTAKVLAAVPGLFDEAAGVAVKRAVDKAGDFWHNTLLWDRVADLQMGLYTNLRDDAIGKGIDPQTASRMAAHFANRYAGALPKEAMSDAAAKVSNMLMFSRSFTLGNLGVLKDVFTGLPKDVLAQIERDAGFRAGSIEAGVEAGQEAAAVARGMARRKAMAVVAMDMGLMYIGNSLLQNVMNVMFNDSTLDKETHGYAERFLAKMQAVKEHPLELLQPLKLVGDLSATSENEPGKGDRVRVGYAKDGTAIYARNPSGKIGDEFVGYMTGPLDMMRKKLGTIARPAWQIMSNDAGFGRKVYDPDADTSAKYLKNLGLIAAHLVKSQFPEGQISAFSDLVKGEGDAKVNALQAVGPFAGVTFAKGAPGGPAVGEMYASRSQHEFKVNQALPDIRKQIQRGDIAGAMDRMTDLDIPAGLQRFYVKTTLDPALRMSPRATRDFYLHSTPEQRARFERALTAPQSP